MSFWFASVNDFLKRFEESPDLSFPLPSGITNEAIHETVYSKRLGRIPEADICIPDYDWISESLKRPNMTLLYQWNRYRMICEADDLKYYSYRHFCRQYGIWCDEHGRTYHLRQWLDR